MIGSKKLKSFLSSRKGATFLEIARNFNVKNFDNKKLTYFLKDQIYQNQIYRDKKNEIYYDLEFLKKTKGKVTITKKGFGFVKTNPEEGEDIFIPPIFINKSLDGDEVEVNVYFAGERSFGAITKIIKRKRENIVVFVDSNKEIHLINDKLVHTIEIVDFSSQFLDHFLKLKIVEIKRDVLICKIIKDLGSNTTPYKDIDVFIEESKVRNIFPTKVIKESELLPDTVEIKDKDRIDYRDELIYTIDGESTKDFDDAISVKKNLNSFTLGVFIADVSYYVKENSEIDKEAMERQTSIYLIDKVIPMLPEKLSNGICSLNPNVDRNTLGIEMEIDFQGKVINKRIKPFLINSKYRLTYNEVNNMENNWIKNDEKIYSALKNALDLYKILENKKENDGYIDFEISEPKILLDENGKTKNISLRTRGDSEKLIESFMVLANEEVANYTIFKKIPSLYRVHEYPNIESIQNFQNLLNFLGINVQLPTTENRNKFYKAIREIKIKRFDDLIKIFMLRTMQKAKYSYENIGHFGLASPAYSHFTSPIRRYPDLIVHRILREVVLNKNKNYIDDLNLKLEFISKLSNEKEESAVALERKINSLKAAQYYEDKIGETFKGTIVSIKKFGLFVELYDDKTNALAPINVFEDGPFEIDEGEKYIFNKQNKKYKLGQNVMVSILSVDYLSHKIDVKIENN